MSNNMVTPEKILTIQVFSDLHIETWNKFPAIPAKAKYLFLAGDICSANHPFFYKFFDYCSKNWEKIFYVPGNTEFYKEKKNYNELQFEYKHKFEQKYKNVFYLDNTYIALNDEIDVYGSVFWTYPAFDTTREAKIYIDDYNKITYFHKGLNKIVKWDISYVKQLSKESYYSLQNHLAKTKKKTIVMTHFPPIRTGTIKPLDYQELPSLLSYSAWKDDSIENFNLKNVPLWISGHTHWSYNIEKCGCIFISNQLGVKSKIVNTFIDEEGLFDVVIS